MRLFVNYDRHEPGVVLFEELPGEHGFKVKLGEEEMATLASLAQLESFKVAKAIGALAAYCVQQGHQASRRAKR